MSNLYRYIDENGREVLSYKPAPDIPARTAALLQTYAPPIWYGRALSAPLETYGELAEDYKDLVYKNLTSRMSFLEGLAKSMFFDWDKPTPVAYQFAQSPLTQTALIGTGALIGSGPGIAAGLKAALASELAGSVAENMWIRNLAKKVRDNTATDEELIQFNTLIAAQERAAQSSFWGTVGHSIGTSFDIMLDMYSGRGVISGLSASIAARATKRTVPQVLDNVLLKASKSFKDDLLKAFYRYHPLATRVSETTMSQALKGSGRFWRQGLANVVPEFLSAAVYLPKAATERMAVNDQAGYEESLLETLGYAYLRQLGQHVTERASEALFAPAEVSILRRMSTSRLKFFQTLGKRAHEAISFVEGPHMPVVLTALDRLGYWSLPGEVLEERAQDLWNALLGDLPAETRSATERIRDMFGSWKDPKTWVQDILVFAAIPLAAETYNTVRTGQWLTQQIRNEYNLAQMLSPKSGLATRYGIADRAEVEELFDSMIEAERSFYDTPFGRHFRFVRGIAQVFDIGGRSMGRLRDVFGQIPGGEALVDVLHAGVTVPYELPPERQADAMEALHERFYQMYAAIHHLLRLRPGESLTEAEMDALSKTANITQVSGVGRLWGLTKEGLEAIGARLANPRVVISDVDELNQVAKRIGEISRDGQITVAGNETNKADDLIMALLGGKPTFRSRRMMAIMRRIARQTERKVVFRLIPRAIFVGTPEDLAEHFPGYRDLINRYKGEGVVAVELRGRTTKGEGDEIVIDVYSGTNPLAAIREEAAHIALQQLRNWFTPERVRMLNQLRAQATMRNAENLDNYILAEETAAKLLAYRNGEFNILDVPEIDSWVFRVDWDAVKEVFKQIPGKSIARMLLSRGIYARSVNAGEVAQVEISKVSGELSSSAVLAEIEEKSGQSVNTPEAAQAITEAAKEVGRPAPNETPEEKQQRLTAFVEKAVEKIERAVPQMTMSLFSGSDDQRARTAYIFGKALSEVRISPVMKALLVRLAVMGELPQEAFSALADGLMVAEMRADIDSDALLEKVDKLYKAVFANRSNTDSSGQIELLRKLLTPEGKYTKDEVRKTLESIKLFAAHVIGEDEVALLEESFGEYFVPLAAALLDKAFFTIKRQVLEEIREEPPATEEEEEEEEPSPIEDAINAVIYGATEEAQERALAVAPLQRFLDAYAKAEKKKAQNPETSVITELAKELGVSEKALIEEARRLGDVIRLAEERGYTVRIPKGFEFRYPKGYPTEYEIVFSRIADIVRLKGHKLGFAGLQGIRKPFRELRREGAFKLLVRIKGLIDGTSVDKQIAEQERIVDELDGAERQAALERLLELKRIEQNRISQIRALLGLYGVLRVLDDANDPAVDELVTKLNQLGARRVLDAAVALGIFAQWGEAWSAGSPLTEFAPSIIAEDDTPLPISDTLTGALLTELVLAGRRAVSNVRGKLEEALLLIPNMESRYEDEKITVRTGVLPALFASGMADFEGGYSLRYLTGHPERELDEFQPTIVIDLRLGADPARVSHMFYTAMKYGARHTPFYGKASGFMVPFGIHFGRVGTYVGIPANASSELLEGIIRASLINHPGKSRVLVFSHVPLTDEQIEAVYAALRKEGRVIDPAQYFDDTVSLDTVKMSRAEIVQKIFRGDEERFKMFEQGTAHLSLVDLENMSAAMLSAVMLDRVPRFILSLDEARRALAALIALRHSAERQAEDGIVVQEAKQRVRSQPPPQGAVPVWNGTDPLLGRTAPTLRSYEGYAVARMPYEVRDIGPAEGYDTPKDLGGGFYLLEPGRRYGMRTPDGTMVLYAPEKIELIFRSQQADVVRARYGDSVKVLLYGSAASLTETREDGHTHMIWPWSLRIADERVNAVTPIVSIPQEAAGKTYRFRHEEGAPIAATYANYGKASFREGLEYPFVVLTSTPPKIGDIVRVRFEGGSVTVRVTRAPESSGEGWKMVGEVVTGEPASEVALLAVLVRGFVPLQPVKEAIGKWFATTRMVIEGSRQPNVGEVIDVRFGGKWISGKVAGINRFSENKYLVTLQLHAGARSLPETEVKTGEWVSAEERLPIVWDEVIDALLAERNGRDKTVPLWERYMARQGMPVVYDYDGNPVGDIRTAPITLGERNALLVKLAPSGLYVQFDFVPNTPTPAWTGKEARVIHFDVSGFVKRYDNVREILSESEDVKDYATHGLMLKELLAELHGDASSIERRSLLQSLNAFVDVMTDMARYVAMHPVYADLDDNQRIEHLERWVMEHRRDVLREFVKRVPVEIIRDEKEEKTKWRIAMSESAMRDLFRGIVAPPVLADLIRGFEFAERVRSMAALWNGELTEDSKIGFPEAAYYAVMEQKPHFLALLSKTLEVDVPIVLSELVGRLQFDPTGTMYGQGEAYAVLHPKDIDEAEAFSIAVFNESPSAFGDVHNAFVRLRNKAEGKAFVRSRVVASELAKMFGLDPHTAQASLARAATLTNAAIYALTQRPFTKTYQNVAALYAVASVDALNLLSETREQLIAMVREWAGEQLFNAVKRMILEQYRGLLKDLSDVLELAPSALRIGMLQAALSGLYPLDDQERDELIRTGAWREPVVLISRASPRGHVRTFNDIIEHMTRLMGGVIAGRLVTRQMAMSSDEYGFPLLVPMPEETDEALTRAASALGAEPLLQSLESLEEAVKRVAPKQLNVPHPETKAQRMIRLLTVFLATPEGKKYKAHTSNINGLSRVYVRDGLADALYVKANPDTEQLNWFDHFVEFVGNMAAFFKTLRMSFSLWFLAVQLENASGLLTEPLDFTRDDGKTVGKRFLKSLWRAPYLPHNWFRAFAMFRRLGDELTTKVGASEEERARIEAFFDHGLRMTGTNPNVDISQMASRITQMADLIDDKTRGTAAAVVGQTVSRNLSNVARAMRFLDTWLWSILLPSVKIMGYTLAETRVRELLEKTLDASEREWAFRTIWPRLQREIARFVNSAVGNVNFDEAMRITPRLRRIMKALLFSHDWTFAAADIAGLTKLPGLARAFEGMERGPVGTYLATTTYWPGIFVATKVVAPNYLQLALYAITRMVGDDDDQIPPLAMLNTEARAWDSVDFTPIARLLQRMGYTYLGGVTGKRRHYMRGAKQINEVVYGWLGGRDSALHMAYSKLSDPVRMITEVFPRFREDPDLLTAWSKHFLPFSLAAAVDKRLPVIFGTTYRGISAERFMRETGKIIYDYAYTRDSFLPLLNKRDFWLLNPASAAALMGNGYIGLDEFMGRAIGDARRRIFTNILKAIEDKDEDEVYRSVLAFVRTGGTPYNFSNSVRQRRSEFGKVPDPEQIDKVRRMIAVAYQVYAEDIPIWTQQDLERIRNAGR